jgi:hypothetical protein
MRTNRCRVALCTISLLAANFAVLAGQGAAGRDLKTPSSRLVGHWTSEGRSGITHEYFGPIDPKTDTGSYAWVEPSGRVVKHKYKILGEIPGGTELSAQVLFTAGGTRNDKYNIALELDPVQARLRLGV